VSQSGSSVCKVLFRKICFNDDPPLEVDEKAVSTPPPGLGSKGRMTDIEATNIPTADSMIDV
jgi:hypothetical protein